MTGLRIGNNDVLKRQKTILRNFALYQHIGMLQHIIVTEVIYAKEDKTFCDNFKYSTKLI
jgi:hypothetical protein